MSIAQVRRMLVLESSVSACPDHRRPGHGQTPCREFSIYEFNKQSFGWTIAFHTPVRLIVASLAVTFFASLLAGLVPSRGGSI